jgi:hypothetical protein
MNTVPSFDFINTHCVHPYGYFKYLHDIKYQVTATITASINSELSVIFILSLSEAEARLNNI